MQFRPAVKDGLIFGLMTNKDPENTRIAVYLENSLVIVLFFSDLVVERKPICIPEIMHKLW